MSASEPTHKSHSQEDKKLMIAGYCRLESQNMNIIDGIIDIIFEYQKLLKWSNIFKGKTIELSEDDSKATCTGYDDLSAEINSVRTEGPIQRGQWVSWELECEIKTENCGVVSSKVTDFRRCPAGSMMLRRC